MSPALEVRHLTCGYSSDCPIVTDVSFQLEEGGVLVLLGPNGVGKTTLFKTMLGFIPRIAGEVYVGGENVVGFSRKRLAQKVAYVPQTHESSLGFTVREMVLMGRTPALEGVMSPKKEDERIVDEVIEELGIGRLAQRSCAALSGGELQMVLIARALAQQPQLLVMDEPCANLDLGNQVTVLQRITQLAQRGLSVMVTSHDPNHALLLDSAVVNLHRNGSVTCGLAYEMLSAQALTQLYDTEVGVGEVRGRCGGRGPACAPVLDKEADSL